MNAHQLRVLQSFRRVLDWTVAHPEVGAALGDRVQAYTAHVDALNAVVQRATDQATEQGVQQREATRHARDEPRLYSELRLHQMGRIAAVAQSLRGEVPGIDTIRNPSGNPSGETLVVRAQVMAKQIAVYESVMVEQGLPPTFLAQLASATAALKASIDARGAARGRLTKATKGLATDVDLGRRIIVRLDAVIASVLKGDDAALRGWKNIKRITLKGGGSPTLVTDFPTPAQEVDKAA